MKVLFNIFYYLFVVAIIGIALLLLATLVPIPGNLKAKIVQSGSMEPTIPTGALVLIRPESSYVVGDVITFGLDTKTQVPTTHRIVEINGTGSSRTFVTKGDANDASDPVVTELGDIHGKVVLSVPYMGYILDFARKPFGFILLVGLPALIIIFDEVGKIIHEMKEIRRKKRLHAEQDEQQNKTN